MESPEDMEYWLQRCSICFDAQLDFCLEYCRDQFCYDCFEKYVREIVRNSWGLNVHHVKCPVCQDVLCMAEWCKYVPSSLVRKYSQNNRPFRSFTRHCSTCDHEIRAVKSRAHYSSDDKESLLKNISSSLSTLFHSSPFNDPRFDIPSFLSKFETDYLNFLLDHSVTIREIYRYVLPKLIHATKSEKKEKRKSPRHSPYSSTLSLASKISADLLSLEERPDHWKELQFKHIANFPQTHCTECHHEVCLQCGEASHHRKQSCIEYMKSKAINSSESLEIRHNLQWKLDNSKRCPNCCILINREDGCNKVDCLYCGYRFCWICLCSWSEKCGFFRCKTESSDISSTHHTSSDDLPEIGVPNVIEIQAKFSPPRQQPQISLPSQT